MSEDSIVFGTVFFQSFYAIFDQGSNRLGLALSSIAPVGSTLSGVAPADDPDPQPGPVPDPDPIPNPDPVPDPEPSPDGKKISDTLLWILVGSGGGLLLILILIGVFIYPIKF